MLRLLFFPFLVAGFLFGLVYHTMRVGFTFAFLTVAQAYGYSIEIANVPPVKPRGPDEPTKPSA